ncbi:MAG: hypothetical protein M1834_000947 [Cirrosporium novae-zelandiae]|nr:MAG: hypothetical protein M1834_000947 [Cirrosporium novae-zelandiae]
MTDHNQERTIWRTKCREKLSEHINSRLNIKLAPSDVRLITSERETYKWICNPGKEYLFAKHLSKLSIGVYKDLCAEVGKSFEAVSNELPIPLEKIEIQANGNAKLDFVDADGLNAQITELQSQVWKLQTDCSFWQSNLEAEIRKRKEAEAELANVRIWMKNTLTRERRRRETIKRLIPTLSFYRKEASRSKKGFNEISSDPSSDEFGVSFEPDSLTVLKNIETFGDKIDNIAEAVAGKLSGERIAIADLPSSPNLIRKKSKFLQILSKYFAPGQYEVVSTLQVYHLSGRKSIAWDPEGHKRVVAYVVLQDVIVEDNAGRTCRVEVGSMICCTTDCTRVTISSANQDHGSALLTFLIREKGEV